MRHVSAQPQEVAETIASTLSEAGLEVDLQPMQDVKSLDRYNAVVLGAAIYNAKWNAVAHQFVSQYQESLRQLPVVIFTLGPLSASNAAKRNSRRQLDNELSKYPWLKPIAVEIFAGKYDPSKPGLGFFDRFVPARDVATGMPSALGQMNCPRSYSGLRCYSQLSEHN